MALPRTSSTPATEPSVAVPRNHVGVSLYEWARKTQDPGYVFTQSELMASTIIPNQDVTILLQAAQYLVGRRLFKPHDIRGQQGVGWELIEEAAAANYDGLTSDEQMVYSSIESSANAGIWTKTIKAKSGAHAKVLDRVYKSLEHKNLIKPMKSVKHPQRKMYILAHLQPSEEATGGTWFNDGRLDVGMIEAVSSSIETYCSIQSWRQVEELVDQEPVVNNKRKTPYDDSGNPAKGKSKARKLEDGSRYSTELANHKPKRQIRYEPFHAKYDGYPTLHQLSQELRDKGITQLAIPNNALQQLLDVMVLDDRLHKVPRDARGEEIPDDPERNEINMYRCFTSPIELGQRQNQEMKVQRGMKSAIRAQEIEDIGSGGFSEVPCSSCPVFDICGEGGPVNVSTCVYLDDWVKQTEAADFENGDPWPELGEGNSPKDLSKAPPEPLVE